MITLNNVCVYCVILEAQMFSTGNLNFARFLSYLQNLDQDSIVYTEVNIFLHITNGGDDFSFIFAHITSTC